MEDRMNTPFLGQLELVRLVADSSFDAKGSRIFVRQLHAGTELSDMLGRKYNPFTNIEMSEAHVSCCTIASGTRRLSVGGLLGVIRISSTSAARSFAVGISPPGTSSTTFPSSRGWYAYSAKKGLYPVDVWFRIVVCKFGVAEHGRLVILLVRAVYPKIMF